MLLFRILAAPVWLVLALLAAFVSFLYCVASALCHVGSVILTVLALLLFFTAQVAGGIVFLVLAFLISPFGIPAAAGWLIAGLCGLKNSLRDFITG